MAAHLAGAVAAHTTLPVVGVPISSGALNGVDALYATVQMPRGIPVATVAIDGAKNAALLVVQMLAISDADLARQLADHRIEIAGLSAASRSVRRARWAGGPPTTGWTSRSRLKAAAGSRSTSGAASGSAAAWPRPWRRPWPPP